MQVEHTSIGMLSLLVKPGYKNSSCWLKGPHQCYYMSLSFVNTGHVGYKNPKYFSQNSFICELSCLFTFCPYSINVTENTWNVWHIVKKSICVKILLHTNIQARKAALVRNYFSRRNNFCLKRSQLPSLSCSVIFDQININILIRRANNLYLATSPNRKIFL